MKKFLLLAALSLLAATSAFALAQPAGSWDKSNVITLKMIDLATEDAAGYDASKTITIPVTAYGEKHIYTILNHQGYAELFKKTHGPMLSDIAGLDFWFCFDPGSHIFIIYNAFLILMVSFHWFTQLNEVSRGKGQLEIIPLVGKLAVGLVVCYNLPFVYATAMTMKNVGLLAVTMAMATKPVVADNVRAASVDAVNNTNMRVTALKKAVTDFISPELLFPIKAIPGVPDTDRDAKRNSGRWRLAQITGYLNDAIDEMKKTLTIVRKKTDGTVVKEGAPTIVSLDLVGFDNAATASAPGSAKTITRSAAIGIGNTDNIIDALAFNVPSANALREKFEATLYQFLLVSSNTYTSLDDAKRRLDIEDVPVYLTTDPKFALGSKLLVYDESYNKNKNKDDFNYNRQANIIAGVAASYNKSDVFKTGNFWREGWLIDSVPDGLGYPSDDSGWFSAAKTIVKLLTNLPQMISECFLWVVKWFWVPMIARLANFIFNIMIESYVYILWLAYPFWFHAKTSKAFTGALNTLIAVSFTAATFSILALIFEGFAGYLMRNVIGSPAMGVAGVAAAASVIAGGPGIGFLAGVGIGFAIFYMIGTFKCLTLAPKLFQSFLNGANVVTPMMMGAATAVVGGVVGGALGGLGVGGAVAGLKGSAAMKSLGSAGSKLSSAASSAGSSLSNSKIGTGIRKFSSAVGGGIKKTGQGIGNFASKTGSKVSSRLESAAQSIRRSGPAKRMASMAKSTSEGISSGLSTAKGWASTAATKTNEWTGIGSAAQALVRGEKDKDGVYSGGVKGAAKDIGSGFANSAINVGEAAVKAAKDPGETLGRFAKSRAAQAMAITAAGALGEPDEILKTGVGMMFAPKVLDAVMNRNEQRPASAASAQDGAAAPSNVVASGGGGTNPQQPKSVKLRQTVEIERDVRFLENPMQNPAGMQGLEARYGSRNPTVIKQQMVQEIKTTLAEGKPNPAEVTRLENLKKRLS